MEFVQLQDEFLSAGTVTVGISTDGVERQRQFGESYGARFPLLSDQDGEIVRLYDVRRWFGLGTMKVTYVIDQEGMIRDARHSELSTKGHSRRALERVMALSGSQ